MRGEFIDKHQVMADTDFVGRLPRDSFMALPEREIMEELRHELRETLQVISEGLNNA